MAWEREVSGTALQNLCDQVGCSGSFRVRSTGNVPIQKREGPFPSFRRSRNHHTPFGNAPQEREYP